MLKRCRRTAHRFASGEAMISRICSAALVAVLGGASLAAQQPQGATSTVSSAARPVLTEADFARIETLGATALSPDGKWVAYDFRRGVSGPTELRYRPVTGGAEVSVPLGNTPQFTRNSRYLVFTITPDTAAARAAARRGDGAAGRGAGATASPEATRNKVAIVDLRTGTRTVLSDVQSFALSKNGSHIALRRYGATDRRGRGADLIVRDLEQGTDLTFGNVSDFAWNDGGTLLAMAIDID